jgi:hypothetical protein
MLTLEAVKAATARARAQGALFSIATEHINIAENGLVVWIEHVASSVR